MVLKIGRDAKIKKILEEEIVKIRPSESEEAAIKLFVSEFVKSLNKNLSKHHAKASIGGSFSKGTTIKKDRYDVDIFAAFPKQIVGKEISDTLETVLKKLRIVYERLPGSRDYFSVKFEVGNK